jgi:hypothetical protein
MAALSSRLSLCDPRSSSEMRQARGAGSIFGSLKLPDGECSQATIPEEEAQARDVPR